MEIIFLLGEKVLLSTKYIKLIRKRDFTKINIKKDDIKLINLQFGEIFKQDLIIRISFKTFKNDYFFNISDILVKNKEINLTGILNDPLWIYDQGYIDNFKLLTDTKEKIKWYELNDKQKYYYLRGCYLLNGLRENIDNIEPVIIIDLSKVRTDLDVYYEIGKAFFKSYGYFGTELDSFIDSLISISNSIKNKSEISILKIKGHNNFKKCLIDNILLKLIYEKFTNIGFEIIKY